MIVKIVDNKSSVQKTADDKSEWCSSEECIIPEITHIRYVHKIIDKKEKLKGLSGSAREAEINNILMEILESAPINFLTASHGNGNFTERLSAEIDDHNNPHVRGQGRYIDWMYFGLSSDDENGNLKRTYSFITDQDVFIMNDNGKTIERYRTYHK
jgi:hypothetical protein